MSFSRAKIFKKLAFSLVPLLVLVLAGEVACRIKYYRLHDHDLNYLLGPFLKFGQTQNLEHALYRPPALQALDREQAQKPAVRPESGPQPPAASPQDSGPLPAQAAGEEKRTPLSPQVVVIRPCLDKLVYSSCAGKDIPRTYNDFCWRGKPFSLEKPAGTFRLLVVGGSTVENQHDGDEDLWTTRLESLLSGSTGDPAVRFEVLNAGHSSYYTKKILSLLEEKGFQVRPDMVLYYEAVNEQTVSLELFNIDNRIGLLSRSSFSWLHRRLHYKSMLYTYLVEKYYFMNRKENRWRIDEQASRNTFLEIISGCRTKGIEFVYVKQVIDYPLESEGRNYNSESSLRAVLDSLYALNSTDSQRWDKISICLQRLVNLSQERICREYGLTVIDPLPVFDQARQGPEKLFRDICHLTCSGEKLLALCVAEGLKEYFANSAARKEISTPVSQNTL